MNAQNMSTTDISAESIVEALGLKSHPEGGWYIETYNNTPEDGSRGTLSMIYYLLEKGQSAHWHRVVDADEVWLWHGGAPLTSISVLLMALLLKMSLAWMPGMGKRRRSLYQKECGNLLQQLMVGHWFLVLLGLLLFLTRWNSPHAGLSLVSAFNL